MFDFGAASERPRVPSTQVDEAGVRPGLVDFGILSGAVAFDLAILLAYALFDGKGSSMTSLLADSVLDPASRDHANTTTSVHDRRGVS